MSNVLYYVPWEEIGLGLVLYVASSRRHPAFIVINPRTLPDIIIGFPEKKLLHLRDWNGKIPDDIKEKYGL